MSAALTPAVIEFHGDEILTVSVNETPYVPMKPIVEALGLGWSPQKRKLTWDGRYDHMITPLSTKGGAQETLCIPLRKLNGWLFSANPSKVRDDVREKLVAYQEECFEVLYRYWHGETSVTAGLVTRTFAADLQNRVWYDGAPVLASSSLALLYGTDAKSLSNLARDSRGLFERGTHCHVIEGEAVRRFYLEAGAVPRSQRPGRIRAPAGHVPAPPMDVPA